MCVPDTGAIHINHFGEKTKILQCLILCDVIYFNKEEGKKEEEKTMILVKHLFELGIEHV